MTQHEPTISSILRELAEQYSGVVAEREILERVLAQRPSRAKNPYASIREKLRFEATTVGWVRLGGGELVPLRVVLDGLRFRVRPRAEEIASDMLLRVHLTPFVPLYRRDLRLEDASGRPLAVRELSLAPGAGAPVPPSSPALDLGGWFRRSGFRPGDSVLATVTAVAPLTVRLEHEPAGAFRLDDVIQQDRELLDALAERVARSRGDAVAAEECVLPIYARAPWRTGYPGRPWSELAAADPRLRLMDGVFLAATGFRRAPDLPGHAAEHDAADKELLEGIVRLQEELLASRRAAARSELWNGVAPRASTARVIPSAQTGIPMVVYLEPVNALEDHSARIEERLARGGYDEEGWSEAYADAPDYDPGASFASELDDDEFDEDALDTDPLFQVDEIDDLRVFMEENPALAEAAQKLMAALTPDEVERLQRADAPEEVRNILAARFHKLLPHEPSLFATLVPYSPDDAEDDEGLGLVGDVLFAVDDDWDEELEDDGLPDENELSPSDSALERSSELMERFYQHLLASGKSESTAAARTGDLWTYADFLANYYDRTLAEGDYATLDECLFFFYPRKVLNSAPRAAREMCTSIKQFYAFLRAEGGPDDTFAREMWRRRDQAARVVELYQAIDGESPQFERLFARLFAPYTA
ncbi:MAG TPA: hypothetical protein VNL77_05745 [Roseiflexaceae bacterium]|nr:hypothetical protein [Roseiflexaceae bacterium]